MSNSNLQIQPVEGRLPIRALLIEDSPSDADMILDAVNDVEAVPVDIKWISRLNDGIEYLADKPVDVILLDLSLPDSHGLDCVTKARRMAPGTPIVILTGRDDSSLALAALKKGAQDYLVKQTFDGPVIVKSMLYAIERQRVEEISALNLKAENENVKQILDQTPVGIARLNRELMLVDNNESFVNCLSGKVRLGSTLLESWPGFPGNVLDRVLADGVEARIIELVNSLPNGIVDESASSYFDITVLPTRDLEGSIDGLVLIVDDVSERVQLVRQRESFLAALAHDMNVPLLGNDRVLGALVEEKLGPLDAAVRDALQVV
ncbi:MAG: response regulator, partial [Candidatus Obscuribacterales bacterium]|nr:response regulator [Candidatus Obscuribacterales bacterium]